MSSTSGRRCDVTRCGRIPTSMDPGVIWTRRSPCGRTPTFPVGGQQKFGVSVDTRYHPSEPAPDLRTPAGGTRPRPRAGPERRRRRVARVDRADGAGAMLSRRARRRLELRPRRSDHPWPPSGLGLGLRSLQDPWIGTTTPIGEAMFHITIAWAGLEKQTLSERTWAGMERTVSSGPARDAPWPRTQSRPPAATPRLRGPLPDDGPFAYREAPWMLDCWRRWWDQGPAWSR
jgi:hypothetical protein